MVQLGNVFEALDEGTPRGPDLRVSVEVPRAALGGSLHARVPPRLAHEGTLVERAGAEQDHVVLHLPASLPPGAVLRLRGQGGVREDGQPGDLYVVIELVERAPRPDERVLHENVVGPTLATSSSTLTWLILLAFALVAATTVALLFA
jgi:hypothetical protein